MLYPMVLSQRHRKLLDLIQGRSGQIQAGFLLVLILLFSVYLGLSLYRSVQDSILLLVVGSLIVAISVYYLVSLRYGRQIVRWRHLVAGVRHKYYWKYVRW